MNIQGLHCDNCGVIIERFFSGVPGISKARIDPVKKNISLEGDEAALLEWTDENVINIINDVGSKCATDGYDQPPKDKNSTWALGKQGLMLGASVVLFIISASVGDKFTVGLTPVRFQLANIFMFGLPYLLCGYTVLIRAWQNIRLGDYLNELTLVSFSSLAAIGIGAAPEAVLVMLFFRFGELLLNMIIHRSQSSIQSILADRPDIAHLIENETLYSVSPEALVPGNHVLVKPWEKIPIDGVVLQGESRLDMSLLNGLSAPLTIRKGNQVWAGALNTNGTLVIEATAMFKDSHIWRLLVSAEDSVGDRTAGGTFITGFARIYMVAVLVLALVLAFIPPALGFGQLGDWAYKALVLMVIACPCALLVAFPMAYSSGIYSASKQGILMNGAYVLDALRKIRTIAFDKTGTLTNGVFIVKWVLPTKDTSEEDLLNWAAKVESHSTHPIAQAIIQAAGSIGDRRMVDGTPGAYSLQVTEIPGKGLIGQDGERSIIIGNATLLQENGIETPHLDAPGCVVHVANSGRYVGAIVVSDTLKTEARQAIQAIKSQGIKKTTMLTGDREQTADWAATTLGLDHYKADLGPEDKVAELDAFGPRHKTMFIGDGVNDAPAMVAAGLGVAIGGLETGSKTVRAADVVILDKSLIKLPLLMRLSAKTRRLIWQSLAIALAVKAVMLYWGFTGYIGMWEAVVADAGVVLITALNALRIFRRGAGQTEPSTQPVKL